jgi:flagella basal body P-ring formation protein FlgA
MRATGAIFLVWAAISLPVAAEPAVTLELHGEIDAGSGVVNLGHAAVVWSKDAVLRRQLEAVEFRPEGLPGQIQRYSRDDLAALIAVQAPEAVGQFEWTGSLYLRVRIPGTALDMQAWTTQARSALRNWLAARYADFDVELVPGQESAELSVAAGESASVRAFDGPPSTRTAMWIDVRRPGEGGGRSLPIWFAVKAWSVAPVAARDILPGTRPGPDDVGSDTVDLAALGGRALLPSVEAPDSVALGYIRRGQVLTEDRFRRASPVEVGEDVRVRTEAGAVQVEAHGVALESGGKGQRVRVRNAASGEILAAYVAGPGLVEVTP